MGKTIKARFSNGVIEPLERIELSEGKEITITIIDTGSMPSSDAFSNSAGAWSGTIDADKLIEGIYRDRDLLTRELPLV